MAPERRAQLSLFYRKLFAAGDGEGVELGLAAGLRLLPFGAQPAFLLEAVEGGIRASPD
jgi:hypothetical protein